MASNGYSEIPDTGVYTEVPRPHAGLRRTIRTYKWCIGTVLAVLSIVLFAALISVYIGQSIDERHEEAEAAPLTRDSTQNRTMNKLLSLPWPRRDETWYKRRWEPTHMRCPFQSKDPLSPSQSSASSTSSPLCETKKKRLRRTKRDTPNPDAVFVQELKKGVAGDLAEIPPDSFITNHDLDSVLVDRNERNSGDEYDYVAEDGSTFPTGDTFNWNRRAAELPECSVENISEVMHKSSGMERAKYDLESQLVRRNISLQRNSPSFYHQKSFRKTSPKALRMSRQGFRMDHASREMATLLKLSKEDSTFDSGWLGDLSDSPYCDYVKTKRKCSSSDIYRSIDGSCNNLKHHDWGNALTAFRRAMPPDYADGILEPRRGANGRTLPNPREVSLKVHIYRRVDSNSYTHLAMSWGQFIDHDITATAQAKGENGTSLSCCHKDVLENRSLSHPECFEIPIPEDDDFFRSKNRTCMEFSRSASAPRCSFGPRDQLNQNTHFLDGSAIYGSSIEEMNQLRTHKEGLLKMQITIDGRQMLSPSLNPNDSCNTAQQIYWKQHCFISGDSRVNEHILLTVQHTIWTRQHNYVAGELRDINANWGDEKLFHETRKIVIAQIQHITYHEYLPSIIGPRFSYGLKLSPTFSGEYWSHYDPTVHPGIANGFAGAAFRFGHSMIQGLMQSIDSSGQNVKFEQIRKYFFKPFAIYDPDTIADLVRGEVSQRAAAVDAYFTPQVTRHLFQTANVDYGLDLVAINIQRGRDHGIPGYTRWRMMCGLPAVQNFTDLEEDMNLESLKALSTVYKHVDDIDLYTGGLAEYPVKDGLVGPTFACIIADQFLRLKMGDRFWYENGPSEHAFTKDQLFEVHKTSLSRILCSNIGSLGSIQRWPMRKFATDNPRLPCMAESIPTMSLGPWEEGNL